MLADEEDELYNLLAGLEKVPICLLANDAYESLPPLLEQDYGVRVLTPLIRDFIEDDQGNEYEVDILGEAERDGEQLVIVGKCKIRLSEQDVDRFLHCELKPVQQIFSGRTLFPVMVAHAVTTKRVHQHAQEQGVALYLSYQFRGRTAPSEP
jgi:hypothetical protein